jgi:hypothetical protein
MKNHPSFHGSISKIEAARKLIESERSCYLTRYSDYHKFCAISMLTKLGEGDGELLQHCELEITQEGSQFKYRVAGADQKFEGISELLEHYQKHLLDKHCLGEYLQTEISVSSLILNKPCSYTAFSHRIMMVMIRLRMKVLPQRSRVLKHVSAIIIFYTQLTLFLHTTPK